MDPLQSVTQIVFKGEYFHGLVQECSFFIANANIDLGQDWLK